MTYQAVAERRGKMGWKSSESLMQTHPRAARAARFHVKDEDQQTSAV